MLFDIMLSKQLLLLLSFWSRIVVLLSRSSQQQSGGVLGEITDSATFFRCNHQHRHHHHHHCHHRHHHPKVMEGPSDVMVKPNLRYIQMICCFNDNHIFWSNWDRQSPDTMLFWWKENTQLKPKWWSSQTKDKTKWEERSGVPLKIN